jgi:hypothetical protein
MTGLEPSVPRPRKAFPVLVAAMPAYTVGLLSPVPFVHAALRFGLRKLWLTAAAYSAVWLGT